MSIMGDIVEERYEDHILPPLKEKLIKAEEYLKHFVYVLANEGLYTYYYDGKVISIKEISDFIETL